MSDEPQLAMGKRRVGLEERLYQWLGHYDYPYTHPPGHELRMMIDDDQLARVGNDGFELWLGTMDHWHVFYRAPEARKLARFILWNWWAKATWFGLRPWLWYKLLARRCNRDRARMKQ